MGAEHGGAVGPINRQFIETWELLFEMLAMASWQQSHKQQCQRPEQPRCVSATHTHTHTCAHTTALMLLLYFGILDVLL